MDRSLQEHEDPTIYTGWTDDTVREAIAEINRDATEYITKHDLGGRPQKLCDTNALSLHSPTCVVNASASPPSRQPLRLSARPAPARKHKTTRHACSNAFGLAFGVICY